jgi:hypothetical protein
MNGCDNFIRVFEPRAAGIVYGIEGLFLAGDTVRTRGVGIPKAARSATGAALDRHLGRSASAVRY